MKKIVLSMLIILLISVIYPTLTYGSETQVDSAGLVINIVSNSITGIAQMVEVDDTYQIVPETIEGASYKYGSSNSGIASIDETGKVTIKKTGEVILYITRQLEEEQMEQIEEFPLKVEMNNTRVSGIFGTDSGETEDLLENMFVLGGIAFVTIYILYGILALRNHKEEKRKEEKYNKKSKLKTA